MNQEEADQDVAGEVSEEADSRGEVMRSEENDQRKYYLNSMCTIQLTGFAGLVRFCQRWLNHI